MNIKWTPNETSTPQLSYKITVYDKNGKVVNSVLQTRPDVRSYTINIFTLSDYRVVLTVTDIFGQSTTSTYTAGYCRKALRLQKNQPKQLITLAIDWTQAEWPSM